MAAFLDEKRTMEWSSLIGRGGVESTKKLAGSFGNFHFFPTIHEFEPIDKFCSPAPNWVPKNCLLGYSARVRAPLLKKKKGGLQGGERTALRWSSNVLYDDSSAFSCRKR